MKCYSTNVLTVLPTVAPMIAPPVPIATVPLATVPVPNAAKDALVKAAPDKLEMAVPVPAAPNTPAAPNAGAITGAATTHATPIIVAPIADAITRFLVMIDSFFVCY